MTNTIDLRGVVRDLAVDMAGGANALGRKLGIRGQAIAQWDMVPVERVQKVAEITGIPPYWLRPDIYNTPARRGPRLMGIAA